ncbi:MAG: alpha/beta hydrolase domain-containing protein [Burkholderiales bacterium]
MLLKKRTTFSRRAAWLGVASTAALLTCASPAQARVTRIIVDAVAPISGQPYEMLTGRAFGELDPGDTHNTLITDIAAAPKNTNGKVEYIASFVLRKPTDMSTASGVMWHDVPNRGGDVAFPTDSFAAKDVHLLSGWQGDNAGATSVPVNASSLAPIALIGHHWVQVPKLVGVTGTIFGRIVNRSGLNAAPLNVMGNPIPYFPVNAADNTGATLTTHTHETIDGVVTVGEVIPNSQWKFCGGGTFASPTPVTTLPVQVCMMNGFDPAKLYELVYAVKDPYVLGAGTAAFRDVNSFFKYELMDDFGTLNPVASKIKWSIVRGSSQSGNFTRHFIFLGMNQDESNRIGHEGAWPLIAGRRVANNSRWGQPDGVLELYQMGSEGPQWWTAWPDVVRGLPTAGILDRCTASSTCPKIIETFGGAEVFALKMTTSWVGTSADTDIPVPRNVRRYYLPSSTHGGGNGAMDENPAAVGANCPGNNWGTGTLRANPVPATGLVNRMRVALRDWVTVGTPPPLSRYPTLAGKNLADPTMAAMGFPSGIPGIPDSIFLPENFVNPVFDYDFGPEFDHSNATGNPTNAPPVIKHVIKMKVPRVDADGNEIGGVPTVLRDAPLGTYLGWNITSAGFHVGQQCNYVGGMVPFAKTKAQRLANGDPRLSLEERYGTHAGYVAAVTAAANNAYSQGYLLMADRDALIAQAGTSNVCNQPGDGGKCNPASP